MCGLPVDTAEIPPGAKTVLLISLFRVLQKQLQQQQTITLVLCWESGVDYHQRVTWGEYLRVEWSYVPVASEMEEVRLIQPLLFQTSQSRAQGS